LDIFPKTLKIRKYPKYITYTIKQLINMKIKLLYILFLFFIEKKFIYLQSVLICYTISKFEMTGGGSHLVVVHRNYKFKV